MGALRVLLIGLILLASGCMETAQNTPELTVTTTLKALETTLPPKTTITSSTVPPAPSTTSTLPATSTTATTTTTTQTTTTTNPDITVTYEYWHGADYIWYYSVPSILDWDENSSIFLEVNNSKNATFHMYVLGPKQSEKCRESSRFTDCLGGEEEYHSIRMFNQTINVTGNYSISIDNKLGGAKYILKWTFKNPSERTRRTWDEWVNEDEGCLYYENNATICDVWNFRDCWRDNLKVCNQSCCKITRADKNITWYQKCLSSQEFYDRYNQWPYGYKIYDIPGYVWYISKFRDNNCQDWTHSFND